MANEFGAYPNGFNMNPYPGMTAPMNFGAARQSQTPKFVEWAKVKGRAGADEYALSGNTAAFLFDENSSSFWIKTPTNDPFKQSLTEYRIVGPIDPVREESERNYAALNERLSKLERMVSESVKSGIGRADRSPDSDATEPAEHPEF